MIKEVEITKELIIPLVRRKQPALEQPMLELPMPLQEEPRQEETTKEITLRGVWTVDI